METFEEKILAYLDGSLSGSDREDVRASIAGGDARGARLLGAHQRLEDLYGLVATPVSAPLSVQRALALQVPVLALKLPYLATPERRRRGAIFGWFDSSIAHDALRPSQINTILILLLALLAGGVWYAVNHSNHGVSSSTSNVPTSGNFSGGASSNGPSSGSGSGNSLKNISPLNSRSSNSSPSNMGRSSSSRSVLKSSASSRLSLKSSSSGRSSSKLSASSSSVRPSSPFRPSSPRLPAALENAPAENAPKLIVPDKVIAPPQPPAPATPPEPVLPPLELRTLDISQLPARLHASNAAILIPVHAGEEPSYSPVRIFIGEDNRILRFNPQANPSDAAIKVPGSIWSSSVQAQGTEAGIDYELTPWIAIGARGGNARFVQAKPVSHQAALVPGYPLTRTVTETALLDPFAPWASASATFTPNPEARLHYSFTAAAGNVFLGGFSPLLLGEASATYRLQDHFALRAAGSYEGAWITSAGLLTTGASSGNTSSQPRGAAIQSQAASKVFSQSLGFSVGLVLHP